MRSPCICCRTGSRHERGQATPVAVLAALRHLDPAVPDRAARDPVHAAPHRRRDRVRRGDVRRDLDSLRAAAASSCASRSLGSRIGRTGCTPSTSSAPVSAACSSSPSSAGSTGRASSSSSARSRASAPSRFAVGPADARRAIVAAGRRSCCSPASRSTNAFLHQDGDADRARHLGEGSARSASRLRAMERLLPPHRRRRPGRSRTRPRSASSSTAPRAPRSTATRATPTDSDFLRDEIQNLVHYIRQPADVAVIGVGGGTDVLSALEFDQRSVTGIEINGDIVDIVNGRYGDFTGHLDRDPRVDIVNDEARSYLTRTDRQFDIIQISLIDTWAATSSGAFALSENSLYTTRRLEHVPRPARARRRALGDALLPNDGSRGQGGAAARDVPHGRARREGPHRARRRGPARPHHRLSGADRLRRRSRDRARRARTPFSAADRNSVADRAERVRLHARC